MPRTAVLVLVAVLSVVLAACGRLERVRRWRPGDTAAEAAGALHGRPARQAGG